MTEMNRAQFQLQLKELLKHDVAGVTFDEKLRMVSEGMVETALVHENLRELTRSAPTDLPSQLKHMSGSLMRLIQICGLFFHVIADNQGKNFAELRRIIRDDLAHLRRIEGQKYALSMLFPKGHRLLFRAYDEYRGATLFRKRMEAANDLLVKLRAFGKADVLHGFDSFISDLNQSLRADIEKRVVRVRTTQIEEDIAIVPNYLGLREYYRESYTTQATPAA